MRLEAQALADAEIVRLPIGGVERYTEAGGTEIGKLHGPPVEQSLGLHRAATVATAFLAHDGDVAAAHLPAASSWIGCCGASQRSRSEEHTSELQSLMRTSSAV